MCGRRLMSDTGIYLWRPSRAIHKSVTVHGEKNPPYLNKVMLLQGNEVRRKLHHNHIK